MISWCHSLIWFQFLLQLSTCSDITDVMTPKYNTGTKKEAFGSNETLTKVEENIISTVNCLKACVCNFLSNFYFSPNNSPSKLMKNVFISSKKHFLFSRYSNFCIFVFPSFSLYQPLF